MSVMRVDGDWYMKQQRHVPGCDCGTQDEPFLTVRDPRCKAWSAVQERALEMHDAIVGATTLRDAADAIRKRGANYRSQALTASHVGQQRSAEQRMEDCEHIADWLIARADTIDGLT